jgi:succinylglutamate desuccinylase
MTHGNEPSGLAIFEHLLKTVGVREKLLRGTLYLVVNNIKASEAFFAAQTEEAIRAARYVELNMNRLPTDLLERQGDHRYEILRAQELYPVWSRFDYGLDVHSTTTPGRPMIISRGGIFYPELVRGFPIETLISNIDTVQIGKPPFALYGGLEGKSPVCAIETGQHTAWESFARASVCAESLLRNLGMIENLPFTDITKEYEEYRIEGSIMFPDHNFDFVRQFEPFEAMTKGEPLAEDKSGNVIHAPFDGHLVMPGTKGKRKDITEEVAFLSVPVQVRRIK